MENIRKNKPWLFAAMAFHTINLEEFKLPVSYGAKLKLQFSLFVSNRDLQFWPGY
jgi:hypothetical protein